MQRIPYMRDLDGVRELMVPHADGMISAASAVKHRIAINGRIYTSLAELQQAYITNLLPE